MITIKDIAARTGFSPTTISLVLNNKDQARYISAATKEIIRKAVQEMGYRPNIFARSLRARRSYMVGLLVYDILDPYCTPIVKTIEATLVRHDYTLLISDLGYDQNRYREALDILMGRRVDGIIAIANHFPQDVAALYRTAAETPVVVIGRICRSPATTYFVVGDREGGYLSARHLLNLNHREIGFIWDQGTFEWSVLRWKGVTKALSEAGLSLLPEQIALVEDKSPESGYEAARRLLDTGRSFTAICAVNDRTAFGAIRAIFDAGLSVPEDISVIGFDDLSISRYYNPPLTTIAQPLEKLGSLAAEALLSHMANKRKQMSSRTLQPVLVVRRTTRALAAAQQTSRA